MRPAGDTKQMLNLLEDRIKKAGWTKEETDEINHLFDAISQMEMTAGESQKYHELLDKF